MLALEHGAQALLDLAPLAGLDQIDQGLAGEFGRVVKAEQFREGEIGASQNAFLHETHSVPGRIGELLVARFEIGEALLRAA